MADAGRFLEIDIDSTPVRYDPMAGWVTTVTIKIASDSLDAATEAVALCADYADHHLGDLAYENINTPPEGR